MSEKPAIQINYRLGDAPLINIYADDEQHAAELLGALTRLSGEIAEVGSTLNVAANLGGRQVPESRPGPAQSEFNGTPVPSCPHGVMVRKFGTSSRGAWSGSFCPANDKSCKVIWDPKPR